MACSLDLGRGCVWRDDTLRPAARKQKIAPRGIASHRHRRLSFSHHPDATPHQQVVGRGFDAPTTGSGARLPRRPAFFTHPRALFLEVPRLPASAPSLIPATTPPPTGGITFPNRNHFPEPESPSQSGIKPGRTRKRPATGRL